jgi:alpha-glucuronidase
VAEVFNDPARVPEDFLLWFHHRPWTSRVASSGRTLWDELVHRYSRGVAQVERMQSTWTGLRGQVDAERHHQVDRFLAIQRDEAQWWRDASIAYFQTFSGLPLAEGEAPPAHSLEYYKALEFPHAPGDTQ